MAESLPQRLQRAANRALAPLGLHLSRPTQAFDLEGLLARAARRGPALGAWIDVGASDGVWSLRARRHFPRAQYALFEPLAERQPALQALRARHGFHVIAAAAGARPGTIEFAVDPELDGSSVAPAGAPGARRVPVATIDETVERLRLPAPYGIKLDTHGHEVAVLEGAARTLAAAELLVIEAYNFPLSPECLRFHELCAWLERRDFRCCDLADPMRRPGDGAFWQVDLAFARSTHPLFRSASYR